MTRKITLSVILILLIVACYLLIFGNQTFIREKVVGIKQLALSSKALTMSAATLEKNVTVDYKNKEKELENAIKQYSKTKSEYEDMIESLPSQSNDDLMSIEENNLKDIYNVDFLWTIIGNYASEEGIDLKFDIIKNTTSKASLNNKSSKFIICDLKFVIKGKYINLTDFIYDLEDDDRLNFEINDFNMIKDGSDLQVTLNVKEVKVNSENLIESSANKAVNSSEVVQTIDGLMSSDKKENTKEESKAEKNKN